MILLLFSIWCIIGTIGFIFWWTKDLDFTIKEIVPTILLAFLGPFIFGLFIMDVFEDNEKIFFKKRK